MDGFGRTGDEQVDPFVAKQHGALQVQLARSATNGGLSIFKVVQCDKLVAGDINDGGFVLHRNNWRDGCRHRLDHRVQTGLRNRKEGQKGRLRVSTRSDESFFDDTG